MRRKPQVERLEGRCTPATLSLSISQPSPNGQGPNGQLHLTGQVTPTGSHANNYQIVLSGNAVPGYTIYIDNADGYFDWLSGAGAADWIPDTDLHAVAYDTTPLLPYDNSAEVVFYPWNSAPTISNFSVSTNNGINYTVTGTVTDDYVAGTQVRVWAPNIAALGAAGVWVSVTANQGSTTVGTFTLNFVLGNGESGESVFAQATDWFGVQSGSASSVAT